MIQELVGRRKRATDTTTPSIDYPGWKTQFGNPTKGLILAKEEETYFFGFGNCPSQKPDEAALLKSAKTEDVISYYRTVLRTDCLPATSGLINGYVSQGIIKLNDKNIELVADHRFLTQAKLGLPELIMVSGATELSAFSIVFQDHYKRGKSPSAQVGPDGSRKISKSTGFIGEVFLTYLKLARQSARHHVATLSRTAVLNLNTIFTKLAQDEQNLQRCADCVEGKEVNLNDRLYIMGLSLFIKKGLGFDEKEPNIFKAFETFYKGNADKFEKFVNVYS
ncbi:uncharacterized protein LOC110849132 [Folsomia candida]|nr:uncharacterized protein LOC110849132 [Folsomia candida]